MLPARARNVHVAMDDLIEGCFGVRRNLRASSEARVMRTAQEGSRNNFHIRCHYGLLMGLTGLYRSVLASHTCDLTQWQSRPAQLRNG